jgi:hypothetical protein
MLSGIDLCNLVVSAQVEDSHVAVRIAAGSHGILLVELGHHQLRLLRNHGLHQHLVLQRDLLDDSS